MYKDTSKRLSPWMQFLWDLDAAAQVAFEPMKKPQPGEYCDLWFLGVHPDYRGNGIANHLMRATLPLVKQHGFKYATIEATSAFTSNPAC